MSCACAQDYVEDMLDLLQYKQLKKVAGVCVECDGRCTQCARQGEVLVKPGYGTS